MQNTKLERSNFHIHLNFYDFAPLLAMKGAWGLFFKMSRRIPWSLRKKIKWGKQISGRYDVCFYVALPTFLTCFSKFNKILLKFTKIDIFLKILTWLSPHSTKEIPNPPRIPHKNNPCLNPCPRKPRSHNLKTK